MRVLLYVVGIVLICLGALLFGFGAAATDSVWNWLTHFWVGRYSEVTMKYIISGCVLTVIGILALIFSSCVKSLR